MLPPIVCISNMEWDSFIPTNRHQLMRRFARLAPVIYVEAPLPLLGSFIGRSKHRSRRSGWRQDGDVRILQAWDWLPYPVARAYAPLSRRTDSSLHAYLSTKINALRLPAPVLWLYPPDSADLLGLLGESLSIYHCVDDYTAATRYTGYQRTAIYDQTKTEEYLVRSVNLMVVTAPQLARRWEGVNRDIHLLYNVADTDLFRTALDLQPIHPLLRTIQEPRVAYVGALDAYKVDFRLLEGLAKASPSIQFICVGPIGVGDRTSTASLPQLPNLHYLGLLPQAQIPAILRGSSAAIIPYNLNDYTAGVSPLKLYEYLAAGLPVVATPLPALRSIHEFGLALAEPNVEAFAFTLHQVMGMPRRMRVAISDQAMSHNWDSRVRELYELITSRLKANAEI